MNELYQREFVNQATQSGVPQEKIAALLGRATQISQRKVIKTASAPKGNLIDSLITGAGLQKTASSISYTQGILNEAFTSGANLPQAINITKQALDATAQKVVFMEKVSAIANNPQLSQYAEGFILAAKTAGLSQDEAVSLLVDIVDREKQAGDEQMFKQSPSGPPPGPGAGVPPPGLDSPEDDLAAAGQGGHGAGDDQEAQILQMLASLPPEEQQQIIQQLLASISGGGGPGAGGPPPGAGGPPPTSLDGPGGHPPMGGPGGPA